VNALNVREILDSAQIMRPQGLFTRNPYYSCTTPWHGRAAQVRGTVLVDVESVGVPEFTQDVLAFLPNPADADHTRLFPEFIQTAPCRSEPCLLVELYRQERCSSR